MPKNVLWDTNLGDIPATGGITIAGVIICSALVATGNVAVSQTVLANAVSVSGIAGLQESPPHWPPEPDRQYRDRDMRR